MPDSDPRDVFFYLLLTPMINPYNIDSVVSNDGVSIPRKVINYTIKGGKSDFVPSLKMVVL